MIKMFKGLATILDSTRWNVVMVMDNARFNQFKY